MSSNNQLKQKLRIALTILGGILLLLNLWLMDYNNLFSRENLGNILGGISNIFLAAAMLVSIRHTKKERE